MEHAYYRLLTFILTCVVMGIRQWAFTDGTMLQLPPGVYHSAAHSVAITLRADPCYNFLKLTRFASSARPGFVGCILTGRSAPYVSYNYLFRVPRNAGAQPIGEKHGRDAQHDF